MMDGNKWIDSLPQIHQKKNFTKDKLDPEIWINTLPKIKKSNSLGKYSLIVSSFIVGIILVSIIRGRNSFFSFPRGGGKLIPIPYKSDLNSIFLCSL